ncbi:MAG: (2Fe-2S)-binding protein [Kofleriaceae bacterium]|jgi:[NiFe] hydrogenase diaphorase moiety small subunit|nr:(2Fe-2S)-binding protein [Kofleriaceae bacterium]MBP9166491.1 (2Fe-2S)-binding protein [Kofleriaceae bacterium]MBP9859393.1 (2Fe-2S)-binding protein [Kofleriaceae bacterium]
MTSPTFSLDGVDVPFTDGQSILAAALAAGVYVPYLCYHPEFTPHGSCKVCTVKVNGRTQASCTTPARAGDVVESNVDEVTTSRRELVQLLFTEGNHFCPSCEASGNCTLQAVGYELGMTSSHYSPLYPDRPIDASHPEVLLDFNRCILCELCVRASALVDRKDVFALSGRGVTKHLVVNAESGRLADTTLTVDDKAMSVCPVGVILRKRRGFAVPIGQRRYDAAPVSVVAVAKPEGDEP